MNKFLIFTSLFFLGSNVLLSQDNILTHKGDTIKGKVIEITETTVKFNYVGESLTNTLTKNVVSQIIFENGRVQKISEKIIINSIEDWEKVQITNIESDVVGLTRHGEMMAKASSGWSTTNQGKMEEKAMDKLKQDAAANGCHIILLLTTTGKGGGYGLSGGTKASVTGIAYKY